MRREVELLADFRLLLPASALGAAPLSTMLRNRVRAALARMGAVPDFLSVIFRACAALDVMARRRVEDSARRICDLRRRPTGAARDWRVVLVICVRRAAVERRALDFAGVRRGVVADGFDVRLKVAWVREDFGFFIVRFLAVRAAVGFF